jgi:protein TonB
MARYRDPPTRAERAKAIAAVAIVHLALGALALTGSISRRQAEEMPATQVFDVALPPVPPPPPPPPAPRAAEREAGREGKAATASPVVAPTPKIELPAATPLPAAPVAGSGSAPSAGAGAAGSGPGAGGVGSGPGGGGGGGAGSGIGADAPVLAGGLSRRDYRRLRGFAAPSGSAVLGLLVGPDGRVAQCTVRQSSGVGALDATLCALLQPRMRWSPARDRAGRPLTVGIIYTAVWSRD